MEQTLHLKNVLSLVCFVFQAIQESCNRRYHVSESHPQHEYTVSNVS